MKQIDKQKSFYLYYSIAVILLLLTVIYCVTTFTLAWFRDESTASNPDTSVSIIATLDLDITTNFNLRNMVLSPDTTYTLDKDGQDIGTYIKTSAKHNVDGAYVRVKFTCDIKELTLYFNSSKFTTSTTYSTSVKDKWFYNATDDYYYYIGYIDDAGTQFNAGYYVSNTLVNEGAGASGYYVDNGITNVTAGTSCQITLEFESIQRQYGASAEVWTTAPDVFKNFVTTDENLKHDSNDFYS